MATDEILGLLWIISVPVVIAANYMASRKRRYRDGR